MLKSYFFFAIAVLAIASCDPKDNGANLNFKFKFSPTQVRLDNFGNPSTIPSGNAAQTPDFHAMSVHYIEFLQTPLTQLGQGAELYKNEEVQVNGEAAIDFSKAIIKDEGQSFLTIPASRLAPGTYTYVRASVSYQNYDVRYNIQNVPVIGTQANQLGRLASFVGFNQKLNNFKVKDSTVVVNGAKKQGYWAFETQFAGMLAPYNRVVKGQAPANATTVVNPFGASNPIPVGSCIVTGQLAQPLVITGNETEDINITFSFSINNSFEWVDNLFSNGQWDLNASTGQMEPVVDMGLRGLIVEWD